MQPGAARLSQALPCCRSFEASAASDASARLGAFSEGSFGLVARIRQVECPVDALDVLIPKAGRTRRRQRLEAVHLRGHALGSFHPGARGPEEEPQIADFL